tara:strand:- start:790 stop:975 length:186 start_codon:yes stop_codon:yes gene_type:complete
MQPNSEVMQSNIDNDKKRSEDNDLSVSTDESKSPYAKAFKGVDQYRHEKELRDIEKSWELH